MLYAKCIALVLIVVFTFVQSGIPRMKNITDITNITFVLCGRRALNLSNKDVKQVSNMANCNKTNKAYMYS